MHGERTTPPTTIQHKHPNKDENVPILSFKKSLYSTITVTACNRKTITYTHYLAVAHLGRLLTDFELRLHTEFNEFYELGRVEYQEQTAVIAQGFLRNLALWF